MESILIITLLFAILGYLIYMKKSEKKNTNGGTNKESGGSGGSNNESDGNENVITNTVVVTCNPWDEWSLCDFTNPCDTLGKRTRTRIPHESCQGPNTQEEQCSRSADWTTTCEYPSNVCGTKGTRVRQSRINGVLCDTTQTPESTECINNRSGCLPACDTYNWGTWGACDYTGVPCTEPGKRTRVKNTPDRCGGVQTETRVWDQYLSGLPACVAQGSWVIKPGELCQPISGGKTCGAKGTARFVFDTPETSCTPQERTMECDLPACVNVVKHCVWESNDAHAQGCPIANQFPGGGTCYVKPLDASMYKSVNRDSTDPDTATRCYNPTNRSGASLAGTAGAHTHAQAQAACAALGMRLPETVEEAGATCGTGHGLDAYHMWTNIV